MARPVVRVEGADRMAATLRAAADDLDDLSAPAAEAARMIESRARAGAPVLTGRLAASIRGEGTAEGAVVSSAAPYAGVQEWGWPAHHIAAQPFLVPAADQTEDAWLEAYRTRVQAIADNVKGA